MEKTLTAKRTYEIDKPQQMIKMANVLKNHIVRNNLSVQIVGKDYVMVEGWQFAGGLMGLFPKVVKVENIAPGKWMAQAEIINTKTKEVMGTGFAICSKEEMKKKSFDEYAILSMAQTRAIGKAYRNLIGWVIKMTGYESTPAEEMKGKKEEMKNPDSKTSTFTAGEAMKEKIKKTAKEMGINTIKGIEKKTGLIIDWENMTKVQASRILFKLLEKTNSKKK